MPIINLPNTDLDVSTICLGTGEIGTGLNRDDSFRLLDAYVELGGNFLDTAHCYGDWVKDAPRSVCEKTIGQWLTARNCRKEIVLATKGAHWTFDAPHVPRLAPADIARDIAESLEFLQTDTLDVFYLHRDDPNRPVAEILDALEEHKAAGRIRWYAASNWHVGRMLQAYDYAKSKNYSGFVADQVLWNPAIMARYPYGDSTVCFMDETRQIFHEQTGMSAIPFQAQAFGLFRRLHNGTLDQMNSGFRSFYRLPETTRRYERIVEIMAQTGYNLSQVVLGWLRGQAFVTVPIVGCRSVEDITDSMTASAVALTPEQIRFISYG